jgi:membrane protease YdiL (CAAX protease family)
MSETLTPRPDLLGPPPASWSAIEAVPVFLIAILVGVILGGVVALATGSCAARFTLGTLAGEAGFLGTVVVWVKYVSHGPLAALGLPREPLKDVGAGIGGGVLLVVCGAIALAIVTAITSRILGHAPKQPQQVISCVRGSALAYLGPVVVLAAPMGEETFFRGFLFKGLRRSFSIWPSALISAAAFAAVHFAGLSFLVLIPAEFVVGLGLALIYEWRRSLLASVTAHATFNLVGYLLIVSGRT